MIRSNFLNFIVTLLFIGIWLSIGSNPADFLIIFFNENGPLINVMKLDLSGFVNFVRSIFPPICLIVCAFIILKFKIYRKQNNFIYILLLIQLIQIITTLISRDTIVSDYEILIDHIGRYHWIISSIATITIFMIANKLENFDVKKLFYISIIFLSFVVLFFSYKILLDFFNFEINNNNVPVYNLEILRKSAFFFKHEIPRVTGLSRSILVLLILVMFFRYNNRYYNKILKNILIIFLGSLIFLFQSKFAVSLLFIIFIFYFLCYEKKSSGLIQIIILLLFQILLFLSISNFKFHFIENKFQANTTDIANQTTKEDTISTKSQSYGDSKKNKNTKIANEKKKFSEIYLRQNFNKNLKGSDLIDHILLSGRFKLWLNSVPYIKERPLLGYGSMSDRILINKNRLISKNILNPVSNAFLYSLLSGGIFCFLLLILFFITIRSKYLDIIYFTVLNKWQNKISALILLVITMRLLIENSIMLFGIDFILLLNCLYLAEKE